MTKILLVGGGAREHVIAETLAKSSRNPQIFAFMNANNPGIAGLAEKTLIGKLDDFVKLTSFIDETKPDFAIIGPEGPLASGIVDFLEGKGVGSVGPKQELAKLETSKSFTRELTEKYGIPGRPAFNVFKTEAGIKEYMEALGQTVIKPDGLTGGKGVQVQGEHFQTVDEGLEYAREVLKEHAAVVVEEKLIGEEFSVQSLCDGRTVVDCPIAQDHKRAFDGDKGPNTGGMGSYSDADHSLPFLTADDVRQARRITEKMAESLYRETGMYYKGVLYGGFIATKDGVKLIEYNARFGDPEALNVLPLLITDPVDVFKAIVDGTLKDIDVKFAKKSTVCKYVVPKGYPTDPVKGEKISIGEVPEGVRTYFANVDKKEDGLYMLGSRAAAFVGIGDSLAEAEKKAQAGVAAVTGKVAFRTDIGTDSLIQRRIDHMKALRG
ncbi:MAG: phosphoribosylamine--glycine ligase [archaeon]